MGFRADFASGIEAPKLYQTKAGYAPYEKRAVKETLAELKLEFQRSGLGVENENRGGHVTEFGSFHSLAWLTSIVGTTCTLTGSGGGQPRAGTPNNRVG